MKINYTPANIWRQLFAIFYDTLVIIALFMVFTLIVVLINHGQAIKPHNYFYSSALIAIWCGFYTLFWHKSGSTIGMMAWRLKLVNRNTEPLRLWQIFTRLICSVVFSLLGGINFWWKWLDKDRFTLSDRLSKTVVVNYHSKPTLYHPELRSG